MKKRDGEHEVAATSKEYDVGTKAMLLPVRPLLVSRIGAKLNSAMPENPELPAAILQMAIEIAVSWDDPKLEWETPIPSKINELSGKQLIELGISLLEEVDDSPRVISFGKLAAAGALRIAGKGGSEKND